MNWIILLISLLVPLLGALISFLVVRWKRVRGEQRRLADLALRTAQENKARDFRVAWRTGFHRLAGESSDAYVARFRIVQKRALEVYGSDGLTN
jgi:hypothetical protein